MRSRRRSPLEGLASSTVTDWRRTLTTRTQSAEEYLEAIFKLQRGPEPVTVKRLAAELAVSPPSVSEMIGRLRAAGLVEEPAEGRGIPLTEAGAARAPRSCGATASASASWSTTSTCRGTRCTTRPASSSTC